jgi:hypothetical protein
MNSPHQMEPFDEKKKINRFGGLNHKIINQPKTKNLFDLRFVF